MEYGFCGGGTRSARRSESLENRRMKQVSTVFACFVRVASGEEEAVMKASHVGGARRLAKAMFDNRAIS